MQNLDRDSPMEVTEAFSVTIPMVKNVSVGILPISYKEAVSNDLPKEIMLNESMENWNGNVEGDEDEEMVDFIFDSQNLDLNSTWLRRTQCYPLLFSPQNL